MCNYFLFYRLFFINFFSGCEPVTAVAALSAPRNAPRGMAGPPDKNVLALAFSAHDLH